MVNFALVNSYRQFVFLPRYIPGMNICGLLKFQNIDRLRGSEECKEMEKQFLENNGNTTRPKPGPLPLREFFSN